MLVNRNFERKKPRKKQLPEDEERDELTCQGQGLDGDKAEKVAPKKETVPLEDLPKPKNYHYRNPFSVAPATMVMSDK